VWTQAVGVTEQMLKAAFPKYWHWPRAEELHLVPCTARNQCEQVFDVAWVRLDHILTAAVAGIAGAAVADNVVVADIAAAAVVAAAAGHHMTFADFGYCSMPVQSSRRSQNPYLLVQSRRYRR